MWTALYIKLQLASTANFFQMLTYFIIGSFIDTLRAVVGPLPFLICRFAYWTKNVAGCCICIIAFAQVGTKFYFVFIKKRIPVMNDSFLSFFICSNTSIWSIIFAGFIKYYVETIPSKAEVNIYFWLKLKCFILIYFAISWCVVVYGLLKNGKGKNGNLFPWFFYSAYFHLWSC